MKQVIGILIMVLVMAAGMAAISTRDGLSYFDRFIGCIGAIVLIACFLGAMLGIAYLFDVGGMQTDAKKKREEEKLK